MIAAVDAPCVCLNVAVQRATPFAGSAAVEVDDDPALQAIAAKHERSNVARVPRIARPALTFNEEAERSLAPLRLLLIYRAAISRYRRLRRSRATEGVQCFTLHLQLLRRHRHFARRSGQQTRDVLPV